MFGKTLRNGKMHPVLNAIDNVYRRTVSIWCDFKGGNDQFAVKCPKRSCVFTCCCGTEEGRCASKHAHNFTAIQTNSEKKNSIVPMFISFFIAICDFHVSTFFFGSKAYFIVPNNIYPEIFLNPPHPGTATPPTSGPPTQTQTQTQHTDTDTDTDTAHQLTTRTRTHRAILVQANSILPPTPRG